jgi:hypothetical protein
MAIAGAVEFGSRCVHQVDGDRRTGAACGVLLIELELR